MNAEDIILIETCGACPEQYDAFYGRNKVGYLRLRHGTFYVKCPDVNGDTVYETESCIGDGIFEDEEREKYLTNAKKSISHYFNELNK